MALPGRKQASASTGTRVQNANTAQTVKATAGVLRRIVLANADVAVQTLTVADNTTVLVVLRVAAGGCVPFEFGVPFGTSLKVTPSSVNLDAFVIYD